MIFQNKLFRVRATLSTFVAAALACGIQSFGQNNIPDGYELLIDADFESAASLNNMEMTDSSAWRIANVEGNSVLELFGASEYRARVRSPYNIALLKDVKLGSFVLEVDLKQTGRNYGHRDMCLFYGVKDPSNFYYTHMASVADPHAHNIFLVNDEARVAIASKTTEGVDWTQDWHKVRVERDIESGSIKVFFDDMETPIMEATDTHFDFGYIGFGSFDDTGMVDNVKVWGEKAPEKVGFYK